MGWGVDHPPLTSHRVSGIQYNAAPAVVGEVNGLHSLSVSRFVVEERPARAGRYRGKNNTSLQCNPPKNIKPQVSYLGWIDSGNQIAIRGRTERRIKLQGCTYSIHFFFTIVLFKLRVFFLRTPGGPSRKKKALRCGGYRGWVRLAAELDPNSTQNMAEKQNSAELEFFSLKKMR